MNLDNEQIVLLAVSESLNTKVRDHAIYAALANYRDGPFMPEHDIRPLLDTLVQKKLLTRDRYFDQESKKSGSSYSLTKSGRARLP